MKCVVCLAAYVLLAVCCEAAEPTLDTSRGDAMFAAYFADQTRQLADACLADVTTRDDWTSHRATRRAELYEMLGLDPLPERTPLEARTTGTLGHDEFTVEKVVFQSRPHLYVTANLYLPKGAKGPSPTVLYVCGHANVKKDGVSYGSKAHYQHHACWFARHGYVCLVLDTLQLGEIEGLHHGTYREGMWWWLCRGYTPAGVEAWNCVRALDYLESRPEVDPKRIGVTGRSGGGAYSWWIAAIDERIAAAVPVAGIADLENHVVDGCVEGHCDCMFMVNTYRWDYPQVAALVSPRPLLLSNTDKDRIFPLEGIERIHQHVRRIYLLEEANDHFGLQISEGGHKDIPELQVAAFRWFNRFLKGDESPIDVPAVGLFEPEQLKVLDEIPTDQINTRIHETFVPQAPPPTVPRDSQDWGTMRDRWLGQLREKSFRAWPKETSPPEVEKAFDVTRGGVRFRAYDYASQPEVKLRLFIAEAANRDRLSGVTLEVLDDQSWRHWLSVVRPPFGNELSEEETAVIDPNGFQYWTDRLAAGETMAVIAPRGVGPTAWDRTTKKQTQVRRRFMLLGQTLEGMQIWDVIRAIEALRSIEGLEHEPLKIAGSRQAAGVALYATLFAPRIEAVELSQLPPSHREGPYLLNVLRYLDIPATVAMVAERSTVQLILTDAAAAPYARSVAKVLGWPTDQVNE